MKQIVLIWVCLVGCDLAEIPKNPCNPSPCGPNSQCRELKEQAVCSCAPGYIGSPPTCRPECISSSECTLNRACLKQECIDPCPGTCGINALCEVINHYPICSCQPGHTGDPFARCLPIKDEPIIPLPPCIPSPCGPNAQCREVEDAPSCSCLPEYIGKPPNCRPECVSNSECRSNFACINQKCKDPCPGLCGFNAECKVVSHTPNCVCLANYVGNPFILCQPEEEIIPVEVPTQCIPSPCGINAECKQQNGTGSCKCLPDYFGNPYEGCRPECVLNSDCPYNKACINKKCKDPCPRACGSNAECQAIHHLPACKCLAGFTGDAFRNCSVVPTKDEPIIPLPTCIPSPCGPNAQCREVEDAPSCSCLPEYIGKPPNCRPECVSNSECPSNFACINQKCKDPCPGLCGFNAECKVVSHTPNCVCLANYVGNPFVLCQPEQEIKPVEVLTPCIPSTCGINAECRQQNGTRSCKCLPDYFGNPYEGCRPECSLNSDCPYNKACINKKCKDPCPGACGSNAECQGIHHLPACKCLAGFTGDAFINCSVVPTIIEENHNPCQPSPCGNNSQCHEVNYQAVCSCLPEFIGSPPNCRPECVWGYECGDDNKTCMNQKCIPCPRTCGRKASCLVINHSPDCLCRPGLTGDPYIGCYQVFDNEPPKI